VQLNLLGSHDTARLRTFCGGDLDSVRLATLLQMTLPGAPCIYYGDEIGMSGSMDPECRRSFPARPDEWEREPYGWFADLAALRHSSGAFRDAELTLLAADGSAIAYLRRSGDDAFAVVVNAGDEARTWDVPLSLSVSAAEIAPLRGAAPGQRSAGLVDGVLRVSLPGRDGTVVRLAT
jgi:glycosidase